MGLTDEVFRFQAEEIESKVIFKDAEAQMTLAEVKSVARAGDLIKQLLKEVAILQAKVDELAANRAQVQILPIVYPPAPQQQYPIPGYPYPSYLGIPNTAVGDTAGYFDPNVAAALAATSRVTAAAEPDEDEQEDAAVKASKEPSARKQYYKSLTEKALGAVDAA